MGKKIGAKVFAIAGTPEKCEWLEKVVGVDKALNYKNENFRKEFVEAVGHVDVYFDNVGGEILDLCLGRLNPHGRIVVCGRCPFVGRRKDTDLFRNQVRFRDTVRRLYRLEKGDHWLMHGRRRQIPGHFKLC